MLSVGQKRHAELFWLLVLGLCSPWPMANAAGMNDTSHTIVVRAESPDRQIRPEQLEISADKRAARIKSVVGTSDVRTSIALVMDMGPDQVKVIDRERALASSLISALSGSRSDFIVVRAGNQPQMMVSGSSQAATDAIKAMTPETGKKSEIPIYDAMMVATNELSKRPGIRVLVVIAEGNDSGSTASYRQVRATVEAHHIAGMTALVTHHSTRGTKAILRYGWDLQELAGDTAGLFIENDKHVDRAVDRLQRAIQSLRLVTFEIDDLAAGRQKISVSSKSAGRLKAQRAIVVGNSDGQ